MPDNTPMTAARWWWRVASCTGSSYHLKQNFVPVQNGRDVGADSSVVVLSSISICSA